MNQITLNGFDDELMQEMKRLAKREGVSLNQLALRLLREGVRTADREEGAGIVGSSLDHLIGTWTDAEADEINAALEDFEVVDEAMWGGITEVRQG